MSLIEGRFEGFLHNFFFSSRRRQIFALTLTTFLFKNNRLIHRTHLMMYLHIIPLIASILDLKRCVYTVKFKQSTRNTHQIHFARL